MSYSKTYGRKVIRSKSNYVNRLFMSWALCLAIGFVIACLNFSLLPKKTFYGTIDEEILNTEMTINWSSSVDADFVPLDVPLHKDIQEFIYCLSYDCNISFPFVMGLINTESNFQYGIISNSNDYGLMQINKINHRWLSETLGVTDFVDPYENTRSGIFILRKLFEKYEEPAKVLMAYNLGESGASKLWEQGIYETEYSKKVMEKAAEFEQQILTKKG